MVDTPQVAAELTMAMTRLRARLRLESSAPVRSWTWSQLSTLRRIIEHGPVTAATLAQIEHVRPQSIAETIAALKAEGLVATAPDPADGRKALLTATARGHDVFDSVVSQREHWLTRALDAVATPAERQLLADAAGILNKLADSRLPEPPAADAPTTAADPRPGAATGADPETAAVIGVGPETAAGAERETGAGAGVQVGAGAEPAAAAAAGAGAAGPGGGRPGRAAQHGAVRA